MNEHVKQMASIAEVARANYALRQRIKQLEELLGLRGQLVERLPIAGQPRVILGILHAANGETCSRKFIYDGIFGGRMIYADLPEPKIIDVQMYRLCKALAPKGITIGSKFGRGWYLDAENRAKVDEWLGKLG